MLQGKSVRGVVIKTRSTSAKGPKRITSKTMRSTSVPIERKENIYENREAINTQPSCSNVVNVSRARPKSFTNIRSKMRKEAGSKLKSATSNEKSKSTTNVRPVQSVPRQKLKVDVTSKLQTIKEKQPKSKTNESDETTSMNNRLKLREICFIKGSEGKRMIAKYKGKSDDPKSGSEDNLIVAWDHANNPQVFSHKTKGPGIQDIKPLVPDAGPSKVGVFRVHNFAKSTSTKNKRNKRPLRRLTTATEAPTKMDKLKKRKILKSQTT